MIGETTMPKVREHVDLEEQMTDIERRLDERDAKVP